MYYYKRMTFGLTNAPATFERAVDLILSKFRFQTCLFYLDDIVLFSRTYEEHKERLAQVLRSLREAGRSLKLSKCEFFTKAFTYLGHKVMPGKLGVANKNCNSIRAAKFPETITQLRSFLGMCNVYRRFFPNFSRIAAPLWHLLGKAIHPT